LSTAKSKSSDLSKSRILRKALHLGILLSLVLVVLCVGLGIYLSVLYKQLPSLEQLEHYNPRLTTTMLSADGKVIKELYTQRRLYVPLEQIPEDMVQALLVTEDRDFYGHWGINLWRIFRAAVYDVIHLSRRQGASTLTQQLARNLFLTPEKTVTRKLKEALTALQIERTYSKPEILEMYLTQHNFGHGAYGVEAAAELYFGKSASEMTLEECALLAGELKAPSHYSPYQHPQAALGRRNLILKFMLGSGYLTRERYQTAVNTPLNVVPRSDLSNLGTAPYFTETMRQQLEQLGDSLGFDYYKDGLTVYTTLDSRLQACAETAVAAQLDTLQKVFTRHFYRSVAPDLIRAKYPKITYSEYKTLIEDRARMDTLFAAQALVQVAFIALDPSTGNILALIGGRNFEESKFNRAVQAIRQPGSSFKPFAYTAAIDNGYSPTYRLLNQDVVVNLPGGQRWAPENYDHSRGGLTTLREGLQRSLNLIAVRLVQEVVRPSDVVRYAQQMGITTKLDAVDAIALGACSVIPIELTAAFGAFANHGVLCEPFGIQRIVKGEGDVLFEQIPKRKVALSEPTAYIMTDMLRSVVDHGTAAATRSVYNFNRPAAGKTGTTNDFTDAWFVGFTPQLVAGVWIGLDDPAISLGEGMSGAHAALPIWANFMRMAYDSLGWEEADFSMPVGVVRLDICADSFQKAREFCPNVITEVYKVDDAPMDLCPLHTGYSRKGKW
jgi:penicillin-binding protein 1A